jgi:5-methyltetrahydrofolate--homocysteine methyltransferase
MKKAVAYLLPFIEASRKRRQEEWKKFLCDREGDVHDIGKNCSCRFSV